MSRPESKEKLFSLKESIIQGLGWFSFEPRISSALRYCKRAIRMTLAEERRRVSLIDTRASKGVVFNATYWNDGCIGKTCFPETL